MERSSLFGLASPIISPPFFRSWQQGVKTAVKKEGQWKSAEIDELEGKGGKKEGKLFTLAFLATIRHGFRQKGFSSCFL